MHNQFSHKYRYINYIIEFETKVLLDIFLLLLKGNTFKIKFNLEKFVSLTPIKTYTEKMKYSKMSIFVLKMNLYCLNFETS